MHDDDNMVDVGLPRSEVKDAAKSCTATLSTMWSFMLLGSAANVDEELRSERTRS